VKAALALMGLASETVRRPLLPLDDDARARLEHLLRSLGLLELPGGRVAPEAAIAVEGAA
jgi:dihydrodipicolinate synthase/N-acetylneuraminate lyase